MSLIIRAFGPGSRKSWPFVVAATVWGCEAEIPEPRPAPPREPSSLIFPADIRVEDPSVNALVERLVQRSLAGDYDTFRLFWSVRHDPISRSEYEHVWRAIRSVKVRALEPVMIHADNADSDLIRHYVVLLEVSFDPAYAIGRHESSRQIVLLLIPEAGEWRVGKAPDGLRTWIRTRGR